MNYQREIRKWNEWSATPSFEFSQIHTTKKGKRIGLTAGFLQNRSNFCAVAICATSTVTGGSVKYGGPLCTIPVLSRTSAIDEIQHREGSSARKPHWSSRSNPLMKRLVNVTIYIESMFERSQNTFVWVQYSPIFYDGNSRYEGTEILK